MLSIFGVLSKHFCMKLSHTTAVPGLCLKQPAFHRLLVLNSAPSLRCKGMPVSVFNIVHGVGVAKLGAILISI